LVLVGHTDTVYAVAITADEKKVVSGSRDSTVRIWDVKTGECLAVFEGHSQFVETVCIAPDGKRIVSGSGDHTLRIWDIENHRCISILKEHTSSVRSVSISSDGKKFVSGSWDRTIRIWDAVTGKCLGTIEGHTAGIESVVITANGIHIVSSSNDKTIRIWDAPTGKAISTQKDDDELRKMAMRSDGGQVVSSGGFSDPEIGVWELSHLDLQIPEEPDAICYTNAKVLLVGDSGVGKSGLAIRLTETASSTPYPRMLPGPRRSSCRR